jgi:hypothetical protein
MNETYTFLVKVLEMTATSGMTNKQPNAVKKSKEFNEQLMQSAEEKRQRKALKRMKEQV